MSRYGHPRTRSWVVFAIGARITVITVLAALLSFAVGLLLGIVGVALLNSLGGGHTSMAAAYRSVAVPAAVIGTVTALIGMIVLEVRESRRGPAARLAR